jgi:uncharacterized protein involved in response to NO
MLRLKGFATPTPGRVARPPFANAWFFPAALLYGLFVVPLWVLGLAGWLTSPPGLQHPAGHAHEMLFGYALAVIAGFLLGPQPLRYTLALLFLWVLARISFLYWPGSWTASMAAATFALGFAILAIPRFARAAKKWRNRVVAPVAAMLALLTAVAAGVLAPPGITGFPQLPVDLQVWSLIALTLIALLMFYMGGRILAPAIAGHVLRQGYAMPNRVQPALEGGGIVLLLLSSLLLLIPASITQSGAGLTLLFAGGITLTRLSRWQLWHCLDRPDLWSLSLGYLWLGVGLLLLGLSLLLSAIPLTAGIHALTIGALGSLTTAVMARTRLLFRFRDACHSTLPVWAVLLLSTATLTRLTGLLLPVSASWAYPLLYLTALAWSLALAATLAAVVQTLPPRKAGRDCRLSD